jgi:hypothetical protein
VIVDGVWIGNGFIDHLYTKVETKSNYSATANLHNSQVTKAVAKPFSSCCAFSRFLAMTSNNGGSSASRAKVLSSQSPVRNSAELSTHLVTPVVIKINLGTDHVETPRFQQQLCCCVRVCCRVNVLFTEPLPSNRRCLQSHRLAVGLYAALLLKRNSCITELKLFMQRFLTERSRFTKISAWKYLSHYVM